MFMGSMVHKVIEEALKSIQYTKKLPSSPELVSQVSLAHDKAIAESKERLWRKHPKHHTNILEHYYGLSFGGDEEKASKEKAVACISNWVASSCVQNLILHPRSEWMGIESMQTFSLEEGVEAIVVYDFFLRWTKADGSKIMIIFDWKTGQESKKIEDQLFAYALAATTLFSVSVDNLIISPFYLAAGPSGYKKYGAEQEVAIDAEQLSATRTRIIASARQMLSLHPEKDAHGVIPAPDPRLFAYPDDRRRCRRCPFQQLCMAADFQPKGCDELRDFIPKE